MPVPWFFTNVAPLACDTIELKPEVRQMCASDSCHKYNKCWSCPPGCGTLEECEQRVRKYKLGILVQTVGQLEDSMDGEGMMRTEATHKASFYSLEKICGNFTRTYASNGRRLLHKMQNLYLSGRSPAAFRIRPFPPWKHTECWSCRSVRQTILTIIMVPGKIAYTSCYLLKIELRKMK